MRPDHARVKRLFEAVCELPTAEAQLARLDALSPTPEERAEVLALLAIDARTRTPLTAQVGAALSDWGRELQPGDRLGAYRLVRELGQGGMGQVFLAERCDGHYEQLVAIKLLLGSPGPEAQDLLARERQILAGFSHPHIARLLDGGTTPLGRPYLVMEYVDGARLDVHCRDQALNQRERLRLFQQLCQAVAYAHRQLVVHCDLKPSNVLVDREGNVRLLDFGVSRLQGQDTAGQGLTPRYASPEQRAGHSATVASDIYSLGHLLRELLNPLPPERTREWQAIAARAGAEAPQDRYADVAELLAELRRFEAHLPLQALRHRRGYRVAKLCRRRWPWMLTALAGAVVVAGFTVGLKRERDHATREAQATREVSQFLRSLFEGADPLRGERHDVTALELLDKGRARLDAELKDQPEQRAQLQAVLADVYEMLGQPRTAAQLFQASLSHPPADPKAEAQMQARLSLALSNSGQPEAAEAPARRALALLQAEQPPDDAALADIENRLGVMLTKLRRLDEAQPLLESALRRRTRAEGEASNNAASVLHNLAQLALARRQLDVAEGLYRRALQAQRAAPDRNIDNELRSQEELARLLADRRQYDEAIRLMQATLAQRTQTWGEHSAHVSQVLNELGTVLLDAGEAREAVAVLRRGLAVDEALAHGQPSRDVAIARHNLGKALMALGDPAAEAELQQSVDERLKVYGRSDAPGVQPARATLIRWWLLTGHAERVRPVWTALWAERQRRPADDPDRLLAELLDVETAQAQGDWARAGAHLAEVSARPERLSGLNRATWRRLQAAQAHHDGPAEAAGPLDAQAWTELKQVLPARHPGRLAPGVAYAERLRAAGREREAEAVLAGLAEPASAHVAASPWRQRYERLAPPAHR